MDLESFAVSLWFDSADVSSIVPPNFSRDLRVSVPIRDVFLKTLWHVAREFFTRLRTPFEEQRELFTGVLLSNCAHVAEVMISAVVNARCEGEECTICCEEMDGRVNLRMRSCKHGFHTQCLCGWFASLASTTLTCPTCRSEVNF